MSTTLHFRRHEDFHRAALHMAGAGAIAGLLSHAAFQGSASPWSIAIVAAAAVFGALAPSLRNKLNEIAIRAGFVALAAASLILLQRAGEPNSALAAFAVLFGAALGWGASGRKLWVAIAAGAGVALLGRFVFQSIVTAQELASLPDWAVSAGAGAAFSFVSIFALLPQYIELQRDSVGELYDNLKGSLSGEVRDLVDRGYDLWNKSEADLAKDTVSRSSLQEGVLRLFEVARRWRQVEGAGTQTMASSLVERMEALEQRIDNTEDEVTRTQYQQAKAALAEQLRYIKDIGTSRERVLARMHNYLAAMERLRMAVINLESTNASRDAVDVQPLVSDLEKLGADMDSCSEALVEADRLASQ